MSRANEPNDADQESSGQEPIDSEAGEGDADDVCRQYGRESVSSTVRDEVLERDGYRCRDCGRRDPAHGGAATLHIHHIERNPADVDEDALVNLTTLCRPCHHSAHQRTTPDDAPVSVTDKDMTELEWDDNEILQYLAIEGPARTSEIKDALTNEYSQTTVRERLWQLMGLDNKLAGRDQQLIDRDVKTRKWGLPDQIERSTRGHVPSDPQQFMQRAEDERVRRALARGCDRQAVEDILDVSHRSTFHKRKRAQAREFPLDTFRRSGTGGQHPAGNTDSESPDETAAQSSSDEAHQQLDVTDSDTADANLSDAEADSGSAGESVSDRGGDEAERSPIEWDDIDPELLRQVKQAFIEQLDGVEEDR